MQLDYRALKELLGLKDGVKQDIVLRLPNSTFFIERLPRAVDLYHCILMAKQGDHFLLSHILGGEVFERMCR